MNTITTAEELNALPEGSVVLNAMGQVFLKSRTDNREFQWSAAGFEGYWTAEAILGEDHAFGATVIHRPDRDLVAEAKAEALPEDELDALMSHLTRSRDGILLADRLNQRFGRSARRRAARFEDGADQ